MIEPINFQNDSQDLLDDECAEFQSLMSERIGAGEDLQSYDHMLTCERCRALVHDLEQIAIAARGLMGMEEEPSGELWEKLTRAIEQDPIADKSSGDDRDDLNLPAVN